MFLDKIKKKYASYKEEKKQERAIYEKALKEEKLKYAKEKAQLKVNKLRTKAREVAKAGGKLGYALKKIKEVDAKIQKNKKKKKNDGYMNVFG